MSCSATLWPGFCNHVISSVSSTSLSRSKSESSAAAALPLRMNLNWFRESPPRKWSREHRLKKSTATATRQKLWVVNFHRGLSGRVSATRWCSVAKKASTANDFSLLPALDFPKRRSGTILTPRLRRLEPIPSSWDKHLQPTANPRKRSDWRGPDPSADWFNLDSWLWTSLSHPTCLKLSSLILSRSNIQLLLWFLLGARDAVAL